MQNVWQAAGSSAVRVVDAVEQETIWRAFSMRAARNRRISFACWQNSIIHVLSTPRQPYYTPATLLHW